MREATVWVDNNFYPVRDIKPTGVRFPDAGELSLSCGSTLDCLIEIRNVGYRFKGKVVRLPKGEIAISPCGVVPADLKAAILRWEVLR